MPSKVETMAESFITFYNNAIFGYLNPDDTQYQYKSPVNCIKYIASGHLIVEEDGRKIHVRRGEYVFVRKNCAVNITKQAQGAEPYGAITLNLEPSFLKDYFSRMDKNAFPNKPKRMHEPIMKIGADSGIDIIFEPLKKFLVKDVKSEDDAINKSIEEVTEFLLSFDKSLYPTLFDFNEPWKIDIMAFMEKYFTKHMTLSEFANYTGRSLATFKRDFAKISDVTPQAWLRGKRLDAAYQLLKSGRANASDVYLRVGFENRTHFISAFKQQYGFTPSAV